MSAAKARQAVAFYLHQADVYNAAGLTEARDRYLARAAEAGDLLTATCKRCGRTLTEPESIARRIGPECLKVGVSA